ncbi:MAG TPA: aminotransferase class IV [Miltoncostaeaceae bacterium]|nr:aminotransferase class IV [Miltoncostaeaceae bacterium]
MTALAWLDGVLLPAEGAALAIDDPGVRWGEGLFETMLAREGRILRLGAHLERMSRSAAALGLDQIAPADRVRAAVRCVLAECAAPLVRVRVTATTRPTLLVEARATAESPSGPIAAISLRDAWRPGDGLAEHKTLSFLSRRLAWRRADAAGAGGALLLDGEGRLGEASRSNAFWVSGGRVATAPVRGLLPGVMRAAVLALAEVDEAVASEDEWRAADEIFVTSAVSGLRPVIACDGRPVGDGGPGHVAAGLAAELRELADREAESP